MSQTGSCRIQPKSWGALVGLHEKVPEPRRNSATGALAQFVKRFTLPKRLKTSQCNAAHRTTTNGVRQVLRRQPRAPPRRPHGRQIFPWTGHRCFVEIGNAAASVSHAVKRRGVLAETWRSWYGTQQDISIEKTEFYWRNVSGEAQLQEFSCLHLQIHFQKLVEEQRTAVGPSQFATIRARKASPGSKDPCGRPSLGQTLSQTLAHILSSKESTKESQWLFFR